MRNWFSVWLLVGILQAVIGEFGSAQEVAISYPGLTGESLAVWVTRESGAFKENGVDAKLIYMEGGRLSIQSLVSGHNQFITGDAVSALSAVGGGADIVLLASTKNVLPYVFAVSKEIKSSQDLRGSGGGERSECS